MAPSRTIRDSTPGDGYLFLLTTLRRGAADLVMPHIDGSALLRDLRGLSRSTGDRHHRTNGVSTAVSCMRPRRLRITCQAARPRQLLKPFLRAVEISELRNREPTPHPRGVLYQSIEHRSLPDIVTGKTVPCMPCSSTSRSWPAQAAGADHRRNRGRQGHGARAIHHLKRGEGEYVS